MRINTLVHFRQFTLSLIAMAILTPGTLLAQNVTLEEVVVTAQKRAQSVQDIPISITAFGGDKLKELDFTRADDIAEMTPNLQIKATAGASMANVFIRGIGDNSFHVNQVGAVGIYVDEISLNSPASNLFSLLDLDRVEVLRGPQNTLYGRNTTGGAINYISRKPAVDDGVNGDIEVTVGRNNQLDVIGAFGTPVGDDAAIRVALSSRTRDGNLDNVFLDRDASDVDNYTGRIQLSVDASDSVSILLNLHGGESQAENRGWKSIGLVPAMPGGSCGRNPGNGCADLSGFVDSDDYEEFSSGQGGPIEDLEAYGGFANVVWEMEQATFTYIFGYEQNKLEKSEDSDGSPARLFEFYQQSEAEQFSHELRLASNTDGSVRWIGGLYYFEEELEASTVAIIDIGFAEADLPIGFFRGGSTQLDQDNTVLSAYGQVDFDLTDQWILTLGYRWTEEKKEADLLGVRGHKAGGVYPVGTFIGRDEILSLIDAGVGVGPGFGVAAIFPNDLEETWSESGGRIALDYRLNDDVMFYGSVSRGFKGGGFNAAANQFRGATEAVAVAPEFLTTYELGAKTSWLDGALRLNVALFVNEFEDQQVSQAVDGTPLLTNAGESTTQGLEADLQWVPAEGWYISSGIGLLDAEFDKFDDGRGNDYSGNKLVGSPDINFNGLVRKEWSTARGLFALQTNFSYIDEQELNVTNDPLFREDSRWIVNARAAYNFGASEQYQLALWGRNLANEEFCVDRIDFQADAASVACLSGNSLSYGLTFSAVFD